VDRSFRDHRLVSTQYDIEQPVADAGGWRVLAPFKFRAYRLLIAAVSLSIFAEGMWAVVMALQVIELDNDPASLSLVATCLGAGLVAFVLVGGLAADRISQRAIIIAVETVNVIAVSAIAALGLIGALKIWHMAVPLPHSASPQPSSSPPTARSCPGSFLPSSCWPPTVLRASSGRFSSAPWDLPSLVWWSVRRSPLWARSWWRCCSPSV
jgi:MFS family permease